MTAGLVLSPFDPRWSSGIDWTGLSRAASEKARNSEIARTRRETSQSSSFHRSTKVFDDPKPRGYNKPQPESQSGRLRAALRNAPNGLTCAELAAVTGIRAKMISPLLKFDVGQGRVIHDKGHRRVYKLAPTGTP